MNIFDHTLNRLVLVYDPVYAEGPYGRPLQRREQNPPHRISERVTEPAFERLNHELSRPRAVRIVRSLDTIGKHESVQI